VEPTETYGEVKAAVTLENTFASWLLIVSRIKTTITDTSTRTPIKAATSPSVSPTAELPPPPDAGFAGTHATPVHRQSPSGESAGLHSAPSHHQKPSAEKRVSGAGGDPPCGPTMTPSIGSTFPTENHP